MCIDVFINFTEMKHKLTTKMYLTDMKHTCTSGSRHGHDWDHFYGRIVGVGVSVALTEIKTII